MKAAVIYNKGEMPQYTDSAEPVPENDQQLLMTVKASAIKHLDKSRASGKHYSSETDNKNGKIPGGDGVGVLEDGTRVYALGETGMMAEKAIIERRKMVKLPEDLNDSVAASLPNAVAGSAIALRFRAGMQKGETVLINGATGFTGSIAVQIAKYYGAKRIIATGRNEQSLQSLLALGADEIISVQQDDETFMAQIKKLHSETPIDIIIDYLWGHTAELLLDALKGTGSFTHRTRFISIGAMSGDKIQLSAQTLRSFDLQLSGSGLGSWSREEVEKLFVEILPEMFELAAAHKLKVETIDVKLEDIEKLWGMDVEGGKRLVVTM